MVVLLVAPVHDVEERRLDLFGDRPARAAAYHAPVELAAGLGYEVISRPMTRDDIYIADEAFFTGTAAEVTPIRELDRRVVGAGSRGPVTERIQTAFFDIVNGRNPKYRHWLSPVETQNVAAVRA